MPLCLSIAVVMMPTTKPASPVVSRNNWPRSTPAPGNWPPADLRWASTAAGQDLRWASAAAGHETDPVTRLVQRYFDQVLVAMADNGELAEAFAQVQNMLKSPATLFHPRIMWQVLRAGQHAAPRFLSTSTQTRMIQAQ